MPQIDDLLTCVHCGFCLPACPTYELLGDENDSPRGRLYLMRAVAEGRLEPGSASLALHLDRCLGCRACEPVCPSGVRYGYLLEHGRVARKEGGGWLDRAARLGIRLMFGTRWFQRLAWLGLRALRGTGLPRLIAGAGRRDPPGRLRFAMAMLAATAPRLEELARSRQGRVRAAPSSPHRDRPESDHDLAAPERTAGAAPRENSTPTRRVAHLEGCVMAGLFGHVNRATRRVLGAHGGEVLPLPDALCCGALHAHSGELGGARKLAARIIDAFERSGADLLLTNSAGCGAALKAYPEWLEDEPELRDRAERLAKRTRDVTEWLAEREGPTYLRLPVRVGYDAPCHLLHAQRIDRQPIDVLSRVPGLEVVRLPRADRCCGAAGVYGLLRRDLSDGLLKLKIQEMETAEVDWLATGNPGCLMQIGAGAVVRDAGLEVFHPLELLAALLPDEHSAGRDHRP